MTQGELHAAASLGNGVSEDMGYVEDPHRGMASAAPRLFARALKQYPT